MIRYQRLTYNVLSTGERRFALRFGIA